MRTNEGAVQYEHSLDHLVEFFSKAGSIYDTNTKRMFYDNQEDILSLFQRAWIVNKEITFKLLLWLRDCRGGAGNRSGFRKCLKWLSTREQDYKWVIKNLNLIPEHGRWDDLRTLFGTACEKDAVELWCYAIRGKKDALAAKWAKRTDIPLYLHFKKSIVVKNMGDFRRELACTRRNTIVESKMCDKQWNEIDYSTVPSVAMSRYASAFYRNDEERFDQYKTSLVKGETKINASVLFPHDCIRTSFNGDKEIAEAQFEALPNYMKTNENIMVLCDSSGSMDQIVGGSITAMQVAMGLSLYCSSKISPDNPFYKKFIQFCDEGKLSNWKGMSFTQALFEGRDNYGYYNRHSGLFNGAVGSTRIDKALDLLISTAKFFNISNEQMPSMLLICSDMQFHSGVKSDETEVERSLKEWDKAGYTRPKIVYWNIAGYTGQPATVESKNVALISGFSPSILKSVLACEDFSPKAIMLKTLEKYKVIVPE